MDVLKTMPFQVNNRIVEMVNADNELCRQLKEQKKASHDALWNAVHEEYPELEEEAQYILKCEYAEQGIVMLDTGECANPKHAIARALKSMMKDIN
jgi:hypothetical protein